MRTVILFGLMMVASAIGQGTGYRPDDLTVGMGAALFCIAMAFDVAEFIKGIVWK
jgi:hypothetical protein